MDEQTAPRIDQSTQDAIGRALGRLPLCRHLLTAAFEHRMRGVIISWVQQVCAEPPMILFALDKSLQIGPFLHESRSFAINQLAPDDKITPRHFTADTTAKQDAFETLDHHRGVTGSPILRRAIAFFDCELVRHFDIEGDHDLYVGRIVDGNVLNDAVPPVYFR